MSSSSHKIILILITNENLIYLLDKLARTPLIHAVMNGQAHVASYLLSLGANPNQADSSGNTCVHYAAAYGWYFCLKTLIEAGADPVKSNDWQVRVIDENVYCRNRHCVDCSGFKDLKLFKTLNTSVYLSRKSLD